MRAKNEFQVSKEGHKTPNPQPPPETEDFPPTETPPSVDSEVIRIIKAMKEILQPTT